MDKEKQKLIFPGLMCFFSLFCQQSSFADSDSNLCDGLLAMLNRPAIADSACVVPLNKAIIEMGYTYFNLQGGGTSQTYPEMQFRLGILGNNEFVATLPNYVHQSVFPTSGWTASILGIKHQLGYTKKWVASVEGLFTLPSGSYDFGSAGLGATFNGIITYSLTKKVGISFMLGVSSLTVSRQEGGDRYTSVNPDLVLSWDTNDKTQFYSEIYGQSSTGPGEGSGINCDVGVQYLFNKNLEVDLSFGQRVYGELGGSNNYISLGMGVIL